jgi:nicotinamidase-related amidase
MLIRKGDALLIVDVQKDFLPGGDLATPGGDAVIEPINQLAREFETHKLPVFASRDWHPANHCSFRERGGPWPPHCIAGTEGAEFPAALQLPATVHVISKATSADADAYSAFEGTELRAMLHEAGVRRLFVAGLTAEYCVFNSSKDALDAGLEVVLIEDAIHALNPTAGANIIMDLLQSGARSARSEDLLKPQAA